jgi:ATP-dependent protease ClpP protease subunit
MNKILKKRFVSKNKKDNSDEYECDDKEYCSNGTTIEKLIQKVTFPVTEFVINLDSDIVSPEYYREVYDILRKAQEYDTIRFVINTYGGQVDSFIEMYHLMLNCPALTIAEIHQAYSVGSMITLCCDNVEFFELSSIMIHPVSYGAIGQANEIESKTKFCGEQNKKIFNRIYEGFLTKPEIERVLNGGDFWLDSKEMERRFKNWTPIKNRVAGKKEVKKK